MNISSTAKSWAESLINQSMQQNSSRYTSFGILTPPKEPGTPSKKVCEILPSWDIPGAYSYASRLSQNSRADYLARNTSCTW